MSTIKKAGMGLLAGVVFSLSSPSVGRADQDHFRGRRQAPSADIEGLRAQMRFERGQWLLSVSYRVEAENLNPASRLSLVMSLDGGASCSPTSIVVPLRGSNFRTRGETVFQDTVVRAVTAQFGNVGHARLQASIIDGGRVLERDSTTVTIPRTVPRFSGRHEGVTRFGGSINVRNGRR